ncbi:MAG: hypothetical protein ACOX1P_30465 [Thermoguttaceae bacterium]
MTGISDMHARELVELAALVTAHGPVLVSDGWPIPERSIEEYWAASKSRLDRWGRTLKQISIQPAEQGPLATAAHVTLTRGVVEEIFSGEILTRVWAAVASAADRRLGEDIAEPIARSVLVGHREARHRALTLLIAGSAVSPALAEKLSRLLRHVDRWTDMLVGYLMGAADVAEFAADPDRARDFAEDIRYRGALSGGRRVWPLIHASLRSAFGSSLGPASPNADLNSRIALSILACFPPGPIEGAGCLGTLWLDRLANTADQAEGLLEILTGNPPGNS